MAKVSVLGLGNMGSALARAFLAREHQVTVWSRTAHRAEPLRNVGAAVATTPCAAVAASPLVVVCMLRYPDLYPVGVAGAPPTDWRQYDTIYTERTMRTPEENEAGYDAGSAVKQARNLKGRVMLLHGLVDDNVHPSNTMALADAWQRNDIPFEMMVFPTSDHGIFSPAEDSAKWTFILRNFGMVRVPPLGAAADEADRPMD